MATQGTAVVAFGSGALDARVAVTGQAGITTANLVEAWIAGTDLLGSSPNDSDWVEQFTVVATQIVNGVGFTIVVKPAMGNAFGNYNVNWVWN